MSQYYVDEAGDIKQMPDQRSTFQKILEGLGSAAGEWNNPGTYQKSLYNRNENMSSAMNHSRNRIGEQLFTTTRDKTQNDFAAQMADKNNQFTLGRDEKLHGYDVEKQMRGNRYAETSAIDSRAHQTKLAEQAQNLHTIDQTRQFMQNLLLNKMNNSAADNRLDKTLGTRLTLAENAPRAQELAMDIEPLTKEQIILRTIKFTPEQKDKIQQMIDAGMPVTGMDLKRIVTGQAAQGGTINNFVPNGTSAAPVPGGNLKL